MAIMLKSCFGLGQLRSGVNIIAIFNMTFIFGILFIGFVAHLRMYVRHVEDTEFDIHWRSEFRKLFTENNTDDSTDDSANQTTPIMTWEDAEHVSMWIYFTWAVTVLITNLFLKQSTFQQAPHKIYAWLAINYATVVYLACDLVCFLLLFKKYRASVVLLHAFNPYFGDFFGIFTLFALFGFEIFVVHSFYIQENEAMSRDVLQLKWKHVSGGRVLSEGTDCANASTFRETVSRGRRPNIPPFITNVFLDRN